MLANYFRVKRNKIMLAESWSFLKQQKVKTILGFNGFIELKIQ